jgi:hypothetical protein
VLLQGCIHLLFFVEEVDDLRAKVDDLLIFKARATMRIDVELVTAKLTRMLPR